MVEGKTIFWDVDTQFDFMNPRGRLYVPGAEKIIENITRLRTFALAKGDSIIASMDWHHYEDKEISNNPDNKNTFFPHCIAGEPGSERIGKLGGIPISEVSMDKLDAEELKKLISGEQFHIVIRKRELNVFSNPNTEVLLELLCPSRIVIFGVSLDVCVYKTVTGLLQRVDSNLVVLRDAVKGLGSKKDEDVFNEFRQEGVEVKGISELEKEL